MMQAGMRAWAQVRADLRRWRMLPGGAVPVSGAVPLPRRQRWSCSRLCEDPALGGP